MPHVDPSKFEITPVLAGGALPTAVQGGFVTQQAPTDGLCIKTISDIIFIERADVEEALAVLSQAIAEHGQRDTSLPEASPETGG